MLPSRACMKRPPRVSCCKTLRRFQVCKPGYASVGSADVQLHSRRVCRKFVWKFTQTLYCKAFDCRKADRVTIRGGARNFRNIQERKSLCQLSIDSLHGQRMFEKPHRDATICSANRCQLSYQAVVLRSISWCWCRGDGNRRRGCLACSCSRRHPKGETHGLHRLLLVTCRKV